MLLIRDVFRLPLASILPALEVERSTLLDRLHEVIRQRERALLDDASAAVIANLDAETDKLHFELERVELAEREYFDRVEGAVSHAR